MHKVFESTAKEIPGTEISKKIRSPVQRLTSLWAFSEAGLGGVLHITRLPFKGIFIAGAATLFISLIAEFSKSKGNILRSTVLVTVVKFLVSPHTPITAAIAVFAQGLSGELFFFSKKLKKILVPVFSMFIQFITAVQKILIVTILFGKNFWVAVDDFANSLLNQFIPSERIGLSLIIIITYTAIHIVFGMFIGLFILNLFKHLQAVDTGTLQKLNDSEKQALALNNPVDKKRWFQKPSRIAILIFFLGALSISFFLPDWIKSDVTDIVLMIVRAIIIITLWYFLVSPLLMKIFSKIISKHRIKHLNELDDILHFFPLLKNVVILSWNDSKSYSGAKKIKAVIFKVIVYTLGV